MTTGGSFKVWAEASRASAIAVGALSAVLGCSDDSLTEPPEFAQEREALTCTTDCAFSLPVPAGHEPSEFVLAAGNLLHINDYAETFEQGGSAAQGPWAPVSNVGPEVTMIGANARVGTVISRAKVQLRSNCLVDGDLIAPGMEPGSPQQGALVTGDVVVDTPGTNPTWRLRVKWPEVNTDWTSVEQNQKVQALPNSVATFDNGNVSVKTHGILQLPVAGDYYFQSLQVEPHGYIDIFQDQPVRIFVAGTLTYRGWTRRCNDCGLPPFVPPPEPQPPADEVLIIALTAGDVQLNNDFAFSVIAPEAKVNSRKPDGMSNAAGSVPCIGTRRRPENPPRPPGTKRAALEELEAMGIQVAGKVDWPRAMERQGCGSRRRCGGLCRLSRLALSHRDSVAGAVVWSARNRRPARNRCCAMDRTMSHTEPRRRRVRQASVGHPGPGVPCEPATG